MFRNEWQWPSCPLSRYQLSLAEGDTESWFFQGWALSETRKADALASMEGSPWAGDPSWVVPRLALYHGADIGLHRIEPPTDFLKENEEYITRKQRLHGLKDRKPRSPKFYGNRHTGSTSPPTSFLGLRGLSPPCFSLSVSLLSSQPWFYIMISQFPLTSNCSKTH